MTESAQARSLRISTEQFESVGRSGGFFTGSAESVREIFAHRQLLALLVRRELKARYKDSSLGLIWSLVRPLSQLLIYYFAIGGILGLARQIPSFAIFVFVGLTAWTLFTEIVSGGTTSVVNNSGLVKKIYLPREIFPLSAVGGALFNFSAQFGILIVATIVFGEFPLHAELAYLPLSLAVIIVFGTAFAILLSALNVYFRDIQHLVEVVLTVLFWASPIVYSFTFVDKAVGGTWLEALYLSNPITVAILGMQRAIWIAGSREGTAWPPDLDLRLWICLAVGLVLVYVSQRVFSRLQGNFAQEL